MQAYDGFLDVVEIKRPERGLGGKRFLLMYIEAGTGNNTVFDCMHQIGFPDHVSAAQIIQVR